jgi:hypothetical protein
MTFLLEILYQRTWLFLRGEGPSSGQGRAHFRLAKWVYDGLVCASVVPHAQRAAYSRVQSPNRRNAPKTTIRGAPFLNTCAFWGHTG